MSYNLSEGALETIMKGGNYEAPVIQMLGTKKIQGNDAGDRYRLLVSDGKYTYSFAMLATQLNIMLLSGELTDFSVIRVDQFVTTLLKNIGKGEKRVIIILALTIIANGKDVRQKIGNPQAWSEEVASAQQASTPKPTPAPASFKKKIEPQTQNLDSSLLSTKMTNPISSLSPYQNKWVIRARVMSKSAIRSWSNAKGEGKLFSMDLCDETGEIRATAFKNECDKYYDMIQVDKVYYISRCAIKTANKKFSTLKNDYEMTFTSDTVVSEYVGDLSAVPSVQYDFLPISEIANKETETLIDLIGVCKSASDVQELTAKSTGKLLKKREIMLVDSSGGAVTLTLWGNEAEKFEGNSNPILAVKGARLTEFNGSKSLSCLSGTMLRLNPDLTEAHKLRGWYDNGGADADIVNISAKTGTFGGGSNEWISFAEAENRQLGSGEKGDYYSLLGVLTFTFSENAVYKACPQEQCNKKVVDQENGLFRCEKCNREYPSYKPRILLAANVSDPTGDQRVTLFNESAETMLSTSAEELSRLSDYDKNEYNRIFDEVKFKTFVFKFRTKMENFNDESRLKTTVISVQPVDYKDGITRLLKSIKTATGIQV